MDERRRCGGERVGEVEGIVDRRQGRRSRFCTCAPLQPPAHTHFHYPIGFRSLIFVVCKLLTLKDPAASCGNLPSLWKKKYLNSLANPEASFGECARYGFNLLSFAYLSVLCGELHSLGFMANPASVGSVSRSPAPLSGKALPYRMASAYAADCPRPQFRAVIFETVAARQNGPHSWVDLRSSRKHSLPFIPA